MRTMTRPSLQLLSFASSWGKRSLMDNHLRNPLGVPHDHIYRQPLSYMAFLSLIGLCHSKTYATPL